MIVADMMARLVQGAKDHIADKMPLLESEGDVPPFAAMIDGRDSLVVMPIDDAYMENDATKENLVAMMCAAAIKFGAIGQTFVSAAWRNNGDERNERGGIAGTSGVVEVMLIQALGPADGAVHIAEITRTPGGPPALGEWRAVPLEGATAYRFATRLQAVLRANYSKQVN